MRLPGQLPVWAALLAEARAKANMSLRELGALVGLSSTYLHRWETGDMLPSPSACALVASVKELGLSQDELLWSIGHLPGDTRRRIMASPMTLGQFRRWLDSLDESSETS